MKEKEIGSGIFSKRFSVIVIVLSLLVSAVPAGFLMSIGVVGETNNSSKEINSRL